MRTARSGGAFIGCSNYPECRFTRPFGPPGTESSAIGPDGKLLGHDGEDSISLRDGRDGPYVQQAQREGYRSRACYKLLELQEKDKFIRPGMTVFDLGSAPGGWSQVAIARVGDHGKVIASDILPMDGLAGVTFIEGDFTEVQVFDSIIAALDGKRVDVVFSDMASHMSGVSAVD